jgi:hypothetical protein
MNTLDPSPGVPRDPGDDPAAVCTLPAQGLGERMAWIRREISPHVVEALRLERGLAFELAAAPGLVDRIDAWIRLERECCAGIVFERLPSTTRGRLRLEVRGIDPDAPVFLSLRGPAPLAPGRVSRLAKAAGAGVLASLFFCCALPIVAAALGAGVARLGSLDGPGPIAAGALLGGVAAWRWLGPRRGRGATAAELPGTSCGPRC